MMTERHTAMVKGSSARFPHVVKKCCEADAKTHGTLTCHRDGMAQHILVPMDRVLFQTKSRQLRNEFVCPSGVNQLPQTPTGIIFAKNIA